MENYDSRLETLEHIKMVGIYLSMFIMELSTRLVTHDDSKLNYPEKELFDKWTPKLREVTYGSDEYKALLAELKPALDHHYEENSHHPEHYPNGINDMNLFDIIEMFCDWNAAVRRHEDGDIMKSIEINTTRFGMTEQLANIFRNTIKKLEL